MDKKLLLIILDGVPYRNWVRLFGNLEGWVDSGDAQSLCGNTTLNQLQLAPTILSLLGASIPDTMQAPIFLKS